MVASDTEWIPAAVDPETGVATQYTSFSVARDESGAPDPRDAAALASTDQRYGRVCIFPVGFASHAAIAVSPGCSLSPPWLPPCLSDGDDDARGGERPGSGAGGVLTVNRVSATRQEPELDQLARLPRVRIVCPRVLAVTDTLSGKRPCCEFAVVSLLLLRFCFVYLIRNPRPDSRDDWNQFAPLIPQSAESPIKALFSKKGGQTGMIEEMSPGPAVSMARTYQQFARTCATTIFEDQVRETREGLEASCDPRVAGRVDSFGRSWMEGGCLDVVRFVVVATAFGWPFLGRLPQPLVGRALVDALRPRCRRVASAP